MADFGTVGTKCDGRVGPKPRLAALTSFGVPPDLIVVIVANYGQAAGGITIY